MHATMLLVTVVALFLAQGGLVWYVCTPLRVYCPVASRESVAVDKVAAFWRLLAPLPFLSSTLTSESIAPYLAGGRRSIILLS
jgi:hypothetical protein